MLDRQTRKPDIIELVSDDFLKFDGDGYQDKPNTPDITLRYRTGYDRLRGKGIDCILFIENDDWYACTYIETMVAEWENAGKPDLFGHNFTVYYHIKLFAYFVMQHETRSSAMNTLIKADLDFKWCSDSEAYTDIHLWSTIQNRKVLHFDTIICMGIKHGIGLCGGKSHLDRLHRYAAPSGTPDNQKFFLKRILDTESFEFYSTYFADPINVPSDIL